MSRDEEKCRILSGRDGRVLGYRPTRSEAVLLAEWMARHTRAAVLIQHRTSASGEYRNLARLAFLE